MSGASAAGEVTASGWRGSVLHLGSCMAPLSLGSLVRRGLSPGLCCLFSWKRAELWSGWWLSTFPDGGHRLLGQSRWVELSGQQRLRVLRHEDGCARHPGHRDWRSGAGHPSVLGHTAGSSQADSSTGLPGHLTIAPVDTCCPSAQPGRPCW